jgi:hypothetical protein
MSSAKGMLYGIDAVKQVKVFAKTNTRIKNI